MEVKNTGSTKNNNNLWLPAGGSGVARLRAPSVTTVTPLVLPAGPPGPEPPSASGLERVREHHRPRWTLGNWVFSWTEPRRSANQRQLGERWRRERRMVEDGGAALAERQESRRTSEEYSWSLPTSQHGWNQQLNAAFPVSAGRERKPLRLEEKISWWWFGF